MKVERFIKWNIGDINQIGIIENDLHEDTDMIDWAIINYISFAQGKNGMDIIRKENDTFVWINYNHLMLSMPLLKINTKASISSRLDNLCKLGLVRKYKISATDKEKCNRVYCNVTDKAEAVIGFKKTLIDDKGCINETNRGCITEKNTPVITDKLISINKDSINKDKLLLRNNNSVFSKSEKNISLKINSFVQKIIDLWDPIRKHRTQNIVDNITRYVSQLKRGTFHQKKAFDSVWLGKHMHFIDKKYTEGEILDTIKSLVLLHTEGYFPENKKNLSKNLNDLIYNGTTTKSWFMVVDKQPPRLLARNITIKDDNLELTDIVVKRMFDDISTNERQTLVRGLASIVQFHKDIPAATMCRIGKDRCQTVKQLLSYFLDWLDDQDWIDDITANIICTGTRVWSSFVKETEDDWHGYPLTEIKKVTKRRRRGN